MHRCDLSYSCQNCLPPPCEAVSGKPRIAAPHQCRFQTAVIPLSCCHQCAGRSSYTHLSARHDAPSTDLVVGVTSEQSLAISRPSERNALWVAGLAADINKVWAELINLALLLEVEDDNLLGGSSAEPVAVWREDEGVDLITSTEGVEVLGLVEVPEHGGTVLTARGAERSIGGDGDGVDVAGVTNVVSLQAAGGELPDLKNKSQRIAQRNSSPFVQEGSTRQRIRVPSKAGWFHSRRWRL